MKFMVLTYFIKLIKKILSQSDFRKKEPLVIPNLCLKAWTLTKHYFHLEINNFRPKYNNKNT